MAATYINLKRGQPLLTPPGVALPTTTFPVRPGYVRLTTTEGPLQSLDLLTIREPYLLGDGYAAGWDTVPRTNRVELPKWTGGGLLRQVIPVTLHVVGWRGLDIETEWKALRHFARPPGGGRPPALRIAGPVDHKEIDWTIVALDIDADSTQRRGHKMVRQDVSITLQQWTSPKIADSLRKTKAATDKPRSVTARQGQTIRQLAKQYGVTWQQIRDTPGNRGLNDPDHRFPKPTQIWIPPK